MMVNTLLGIDRGLPRLAMLGLLLAVIPAGAQQASPTPSLHLLHDVVGRNEAIYVAAENAPSTANDLPWFSVVERGSIPPLLTWYLHWLAPAGEFDRWYSFPPMEVGLYEIRLIAAHETIASVDLRVSESTRVREKEFSDTLLDYSAEGASHYYEEPYGLLPGSLDVKSVDPAIVLGDPGPGPFNIGGNEELRLLALPKGSSVTVGFSRGGIVDGPGPDFIVRTVELGDSAGELAEVHVSTDLREFHSLGRVYEGGPQLLDLRGLELAAPVVAVRITGLDLRGSIPGFDLISVEALSFTELEERLPGKRGL